MLREEFGRPINPPAKDPEAAATLRQLKVDRLDGKGVPQNPTLRQLNSNWEIQNERAEFLAVALVLVYVGAVMVLFLFVVMMLDVDAAPQREGYVRYLPVGIVVAVVMLVQILALIGARAATETPFADNAAVATESMPNTRWLAEALFTRFMLPFETAAVILTVAVIAAVMLTLRRRVGAKHQNPMEQARVRAADRFRMVKIQPEVEVVEAAAEGETKQEVKS